MESNSINVTLHAHDRMQQRCKIGKSNKSLNRMVINAYNKGYPCAKVKGSLRKFLEGAYEEHQKGNNMRVYANMIWVFENTTLITVFGIPGKYQKNISCYLKTS